MVRTEKKTEDFNTMEDVIRHFKQNLKIYRELPSTKEKEAVIRWYKAKLSPVIGYNSPEYNPRMFRQILIYILKSIYGEE